MLVSLLLAGVRHPIVAAVAGAFWIIVMDNLYYLHYIVLNHNLIFREESSTQLDITLAIRRRGCLAF